MKRFFTSLSVIVAAMVTFAGCTKEEIKNPVSETKTVQFVAESIETKTAFGTPDGNTYPTLWTENDSQIKLLLNLNEEATADLKVADDFKTAKFTAEVSASSSTAPYTFYAISPASAYLGKADGRYSVTIPTSQKPLENSVDEAAQILYAVSEDFDEIPNTVTMNFKHFTAYGKLSFINLELGEAKITSVAITSSVDFANRWNYFVETDSFAENSGASTITLTTDKTENLWFACAPVGSMNGETLTFTINTDKGTLSKTVTLSENHNFEAGKIANMKISMSGVNIAEPEVYELVTDASDLTVDSKIIIVAKDYDFALSTTQNSNNRAQAAVTKNENYITDPGSDVQVITIEEGKQSGTLAFNVGNGYLYAASSSSNYLRTEASLSDNSSWAVSISNGEASVVSQGSNTRNTMQYNQGNSMFSCYGSASQKALAIYKLQGTGTVLENYLKVSEETIEVAADATSASFTVSSDLKWNASSDNAEVSVNDNTVTVNFAANNEDEVNTYTVVVSADGVEPVTVTITQKAWVDLDVTVAQFLAAGVDEDVYYTLRGTITKVDNEEYGNFYLTDDTGTVYIYGLYNEDGTVNKYWATSGAKLGDDIVISVCRGVFNGTPQGTKARFVNHISPGTRAFYTLSTEAIDFASAGGEQIVYVSKYNTDAAVTAESDNGQFSVIVDGHSVTISSVANESEEKIEGVVSVKVGELAATSVKVTLAAKPAAGTVEGGQDDFHTINTNTSYEEETTTTAGWSAKNCAVLKGGTSNSSPAFVMIGDEANRAFCMNGKTTAVGSITSPLFNTGCGTLKFNYGLPFSDTKIGFKVEIMQEGSIIKTFTISNDSATKQEKYSHEETINISGEFQIVFTNTSPSNSTSNKDRTAIWDVEWSGYSSQN